MDSAFFKPAVPPVPPPPTLWVDADELRVGDELNFDVEASGYMPRIAVAVAEKEISKQGQSVFVRVVAEFDVPSDTSFVLRARKEVTATE